MAGKTERSLRLSAQGIEKANTTLLKFGSKADLAAQLQMSRTTINKFFKGEPVDQKKFRVICKKLKLILEEVADLPKTVESEPVEQNQDNNGDIDKLVQEVRSRCCDKIQHLYSKIQLLNRQQIDVDKLYVDVYVLEKLCSESYATIPDLLKKSNPQHDRIGLGQRGERSPGFEIAAHHPRLKILGKPGSGKTTFLRHLAIACCKGEFLADYIPILIELRGINASEFNLFNSIHQEFDLPNEEQTQQILKQGKVLLLLDGLDEVPGQSMRDVQDHIYKFPQKQQYYKNRFILTCRTQTTKYISDKFDCVEVAEFTPKQVEIFAQNWFTSLAETPEQGAELTVTFLNKLRLPENQPTAKLAVTPILLSLTCLVFTKLKDLPAKRSDLYEQGINLFLQDWDEKRGVRRTVGSERYRNFSVSEKKKLLSYLAARKFEQEQFVLFERSEIQGYIAEYLGISSEESQELVEAIEAHHGLLIERVQGIWSFSHLTFQEYFAAKWFVENADLQYLVNNYITEKNWREIFLLTVQMLLQDTDYMLQLMKKKVDRLVASDQKLQQFLTLINQKSLSVEAPYKLAAVRAFYLTLSSNLHFSSRFNSTINLLGFDLAYALGFWFSSNFIDPPNLDHAPDVDLDLNLWRTLNFAFDLNYDIDIDLAVTIDLSLETLNYDLAINLALDRFRKLDRALTDALTSTLISDSQLQQSLQQLKDQLPESEGNRELFWQWRQANGTAWTEQLRAVILQHRNIGHDWQFNEQQKQLLKQYYDANKLLVDSLQSGCSVSDAIRKEIKETLLLSITEIKKRQQQMQITDVVGE
jgi:predicted NACHT family NTPase